MRKQIQRTIFFYERMIPLILWFSLFTIDIAESRNCRYFSRNCSFYWSSIWYDKFLRKIVHCRKGIESLVPSGLAQKSCTRCDVFCYCQSMAFPKAFLSEFSDLVKPVLSPRHVTLCPPLCCSCFFGLFALIIKAIAINAMAHPTPILQRRKGRESRKIINGQETG